jgi:hypothetical protein
VTPVTTVIPVTPAPTVTPAPIVTPVTPVTPPYVAPVIPAPAVVTHVPLLSNALLTICLDMTCFAAKQLSYLDGFTSNRTIIWDSLTPFKPLHMVSNPANVDVHMALNETEICVNAYTCFQNLNEVMPGFEASASY